jgi:hypothetical protein
MEALQLSRVLISCHRAFAFLLQRIMLTRNFCNARLRPRNSECWSSGSYRTSSLLNVIGNAAGRGSEFRL